MKKIILFSISLMGLSAFAGDLGYRYHMVPNSNIPIGCTILDADGRVVSKGMNPDFLGECGDLDGKDLHGIQITGNIYAASFYRANLQNAVIRPNDGNGAFFDGADLRGATISDTGSATFLDANFIAADLRGADLSNAPDVIKGEASGAIIDSTTRLSQEYPLYADRNVMNVDMLGQFQLDNNFENSKCFLFGCARLIPLLSVSEITIQSISGGEGMFLTIESQGKKYEIGSNTYIRDIPAGGYGFAYAVDGQDAKIFLFQDKDSVKFKVVQDLGNGKTFQRQFVLVKKLNYQRSKENPQAFEAQ